jgi:hypothetical protein
MNEWTHLAVAPDQITAEFWIQVLSDQQILAMIHPSDAVSWMGVSGFGCRIQCREEDLQAALEVIDSLRDPDEPR